jgi:uracil phosphoribosyltransferase
MLATGGSAIKAIEVRIFPSRRNAHVWNRIRFVLLVWAVH